MGSRIEGERRAWGTLEFRSAVETVGESSKWNFRSERHTLKVLRTGFVHDYSAEIEGGATKRGDLGPGSVSLVPAGRAYRSNGTGATIAFSVFSFPGRPGAAPLLDCRDEFVASAVQRIHDALAAREERLAEALGHALFLHLGSRYEEDRGASPFEPFEKRRVERYIDDNLGARPTVADLAREFGMSRSRFSEAFRAAFGTTPAFYVLDRRLTRARTLLETGPHDLSELAWTLGFASHSHLTTAFKARFGYPPREARRKAPRRAEICSNSRV